MRNKEKIHEKQSFKDKGERRKKRRRMRRKRAGGAPSLDQGSPSVLYIQDLFALH